ncbi:hypothetical protein DFJ74DRAFT_648806 [Hyaloraphidium curvatum]|nr:hypothetical protein DFJ74DRAFT_648806 [Hyaloraphidium curvatum]
MPASSISGWSALVTGGSMGLGLESARALVRDGCTVTIAARRAEQLAEAVEGLKADAAEGTGVFSVQCDVLVEESVNNAVKAAYKNGGSKLNIVVHSAGGFQPDAHLISLVNVPLEGWKVRNCAVDLLPPIQFPSPLFILIPPRHPTGADRQANLDFNLTSFFLVVKHAAPFLAKTAKGMPTEMSERPPTASVVAISSVYAVRHAAFGSPYCVSKAGVDATVRAFASSRWPLHGGATS